MANKKSKLVRNIVIGLGLVYLLTPDIYSGGNNLTKLLAKFQPVPPVVPGIPTRNGVILPKIPTT